MPKRGRSQQAEAQLASTEPAPAEPAPAEPAPAQPAPAQPAPAQPARAELVLREFKAMLDRLPPSQKLKICGEWSKEPLYSVDIEEFGESYMIYPNNKISDCLLDEVNLRDLNPVVLAECMFEHWDDIDGLKKRHLVEMFKALRDKKVIIL